MTGSSIIKIVAPVAFRAWQDWLSERKEKRARRALERAAWNEHQSDRLNADLREYHTTGRVPYDASLRGHISGGNPTTRIEIKPKKGTPVGIAAEGET